MLTRWACWPLLFIGLVTLWGCTPDQKTVFVTESAAGANSAAEAPAEAEASNESDSEDIQGQSSDGDETDAMPSPTNTGGSETGMVAEPSAPEMVIAAPTEATITGVVQRAGASEDGHGAISVAILNSGQTTQTAPNGRFRMVVEPGIYTLRFSAEGYASQEVSTDNLEAGQIFELQEQVVLTTRPGEINGLVVLPEGFTNTSAFDTATVHLQAPDAKIGRAHV